MEDLWMFFVLWVVFPVLIANMKIKWNWCFLIPILLASILLVSGFSFSNDRIDLIIMGFGILFVWLGIYDALPIDGKKVLYGFLVFIGFFVYAFIPDKMNLGIQILDKQYHQDNYIIKARTYEGTSARSGTDISVSKGFGPKTIFERKVLSASDFASSYIAYGATPIMFYNETENELYVEGFNGYTSGRIDTFSKSNDFFK